MHATMPTVSALFSGGVSVGLLAGVVSGLFYLVVAGIRWAGEVRQQSGEWLFRQVRRRLDAAPAAPAPASAEPSAARAGEDGASMEPEALRVREFMERLVEALVAGELDDVCVRRLHAHPDYKPMDGEDSPSAAHAALKRLVQQIIQEAMVLPKFKGVRPSDDDLKSLEEMESKTYEDILATAILNKVIERYQQQQADGGGGGARDGNSNLLTPELVSLVAMHRPPAHGDSEAGVGSPKSDDGDSLSEFGCADPLSVTIEECIEEVTTFSNADEEDAAEAYLPGLDVFKKRRAPFPEYGRDVIDGPPLDLYDEDGGDEAEGEDEDEAGSEDEGEGLRPTDVINPVDSWEENWLFQRRRLKAGGAPQPMPVPMLVPNPSEDFRALIGDRDAEDVSDLSDCSDGALEDVMRGDDGAAATAKTAAGPGAGAEAQDAHAGELPCEAKNMEFIKAAAEDCLSEFGQQEGEYTEDYATVTRRQLDSLTGASDPDSHDAPQLPSTPMPQHSPETSAVDESVVAILDGLVPGESEDQGLLKDSPVSTEMAKPPRPGTIAEREHKKWETAPPLPNNPYSPENIYKRLNKKYPYARTSSSSDASVEFPELNAKPEVEKAIEQPLQVICSPSDVDYKRYGRDYYINAENNSSDKKKPSMSPSPVPPQQQVSEDASLSVAKLEKQILIRDVYHASFRARNASSNFKMNPLYETERDCVQQKQTSEIKTNTTTDSLQDDENSSDDNVPTQNMHDPSIKFESNPLYVPDFNETSVRFQTNPLYTPPEEEQVYVQTKVLSHHNSAEEHNKNMAENISGDGEVSLQKTFHLKRNNHGVNQARDSPCSESGYSSSLDSLNDPSMLLLRLTPPPQPQMVERTFESLTSVRRSGSLRVEARKRRVAASPVMGGSLRVTKRQNALINGLW